jgi:hypothetical protein
MPPHPDLFADIDSMDPDAFASHLADDVRFVFGNAEPVIGRDDVRSTVSLPVVTIYRAGDELIDDYRIFMDVAPLFNG